MKVPLASSGLRASDIKLIEEVLLSGKLTMGEEVKKFESRMADYLRVKHFVMTNSGSSANLLIFEALMRPTKTKPRLRPGDSVLVPAIAWPTSIWPLVQFGLTPVFVDVDGKTAAIDLERAQKVIDETKIRISAIFPIHPLGYAISPDALNAFSEKNDLVLVNDVCESLGSWREEQHAGTSGLASSYSFYFSHHITTMEGGGVATDDDLLADDLRSMRSHGWSRDRSDAQSWQFGVSENDARFLFVSTGFNVRPMEIQAVVGSAQIADIDSFIMRRREIATRVLESFQGSDISVLGQECLIYEDKRTWHSWMLIPIMVNGQDPERRRNEIVSYLNSREIETRPILTGNFLSQPAVQRIVGRVMDPKSYENAERISKCGFMVSAHHEMSNEQVEFMCKELATASRRF